MKRLLLTAAFIIIGCWSGTPYLAHAQSGIIRFTGVIEEPPCLFDIPATTEGSIQLQPKCPRPATAEISLQDLERKQPIKTIDFDKIGRTVYFTKKDTQDSSKLIISISYM